MNVLYFSEKIGAWTALECNEITVQNQTMSGLLMSGEFPFSWVVKDQIEKLIHETKKENKDRGTKISNDKIYLSANTCTPL